MKIRFLPLTALLLAAGACRERSAEDQLARVAAEHNVGTCAFGAAGSPQALGLATAAQTPGALTLVCMTGGAMQQALVALVPEQSDGTLTVTAAPRRADTPPPHGQAWVWLEPGPGAGTRYHSRGGQQKILTLGVR